ncbi:MAG: hypothetical protein DCF22_10360 [Leptolyngbya sp.]|nr:MAG: hypothetical protein DCF22_10360 [Leptolyngbya sp.]
MRLTGLLVRGLTRRSWRSQLTKLNDVSPSALLRDDSSGLQVPNSIVQVGQSIKSFHLRTMAHFDYPLTLD